MDGQFICNDSDVVVDAALAGVGLACIPDHVVTEQIEDGRLIRMLDRWCLPFPGFHLYCPGRRPSSPAFQLLVEALRYRG